MKTETKLKTQQPKESKKQHALKKISDFGYNTPKFQISGRTGWEGNVGLKTAKIIKDHWKGKRTQARLKVATALQKAFKNKKSRKEVEVEFNTDPFMEESPQKTKKIRIWKPETIAKRQAAKEQRARDREIINTRECRSSQ